MGSTTRASAEKSTTNDITDDDRPLGSKTWNNSKKKKCCETSVAYYITTSPLPKDSVNRTPFRGIP